MPEEFKDDWITNIECTDGAHFLTRCVSQPAKKSTRGVFWAASENSARKVVPGLTPSVSEDTIRSLFEAYQFGRKK